MISAEEGARRELEKSWQATEAGPSERYRVVLDFGNGPAPARRLARLLKYAKRCGARAVDVVPIYAPKGEP